MTTNVRDLRDQSLLSYIADLELEVDRLRKQLEFLRQSAVEVIGSTLATCEREPENTSTKEIREAIKQFASIVADLRTTKGYHPAHDYVVAIAIRPIIDQVLRWQQRVHDTSNAELNLELSCDHIEWFPGRFRHIVENLISNSLQAQHSVDQPPRIHVRLRPVENYYELILSDNGRVMLNCGRSVAVELYHQSSPARSEMTHINLAVVEAVVDGCGGKCSLQSTSEFTNVVTVLLPRFDVDDYID